MFRSDPSLRAVVVVFLVAVSAIPTGSASGQNAYPIRTVAKDGTQVGTFGGYTSGNRMAVNNAGNWAVRATTLTGEVLLTDSGIGAPAVGQLGSNSIMDVSLNNLGHTAARGFVPGNYSNTVSDEYTIFFNSQEILRPEQLSLAAGMASGSYWYTIQGAVINDSNQVYVTGHIKQPAQSIATQVVARFDVNPVNGQVLSEQVIWKAGDLVADISGTPRSSANPPTHHWDWEVNNAGQSLLELTFFGIPGGSRQALVRDSTTVFQEGSPSTIAGRTWGFIRGAHMNNAGTWAAVVGLNGSTTDHHDVIVKDGQPLVRLGDVLPSGITITNHIYESVFVGDNGDVFWMAGMQQNGEFGTAIFRNFEPIVQGRVTLIEGAVIDVLDFGATAGTFAVSDDGTQLLFSAKVSGRGDTLNILAIPEPSVVAMLAIAAGFAGLRRRRVGR